MITHNFDKTDILEAIYGQSDYPKVYVHIPNFILRDYYLPDGGNTIENMVGQYIEMEGVSQTPAFYKAILPKSFMAILNEGKDPDGLSEEFKELFSQQALDNLNGITESDLLRESDEVWLVFCMGTDPQEKETEEILIQAILLNKKIKVMDLTETEYMVKMFQSQ